jgi:uncharacterized protein YecT (DUF1311 family)
MKPRLLVLLLSIATCITLPAQEEEEQHPIDIAMEEALEKTSSTAGMIKAFAAAAGKWEKEIDRALRELKQAVTPGQWEALQKTQKTWTAYRAAEEQALAAVYGEMDGTMWRVVAASHHTDFLKSSALLLLGYVETLVEQDAEE